MNINEICIVTDHARRGGRVLSLIKGSAIMDEWGLDKSPAWDFARLDYKIHPEEQAIIDHHLSEKIVQWKNAFHKWVDVGPNCPITEFQWDTTTYRKKPEEPKPAPSMALHVRNKLELDCLKMYIDRCAIGGKLNRHLVMEFFSDRRIEYMSNDPEKVDKITNLLRNRI